MLVLVRTTKRRRRMLMAVGLVAAAG